MGSPETAGISELLAAAQEASLELGTRAEGRCSTRRLWAGAAEHSWGLGWPWAALTPGFLLPFRAGGVRSECLSTLTASTPASTSATNYRHLSPGIWLRALTGEWGPWGREGGGACLIHGAPVSFTSMMPESLSSSPSFCPVHPQGQMAPQGPGSSNELRCG